MTYFCKTFLFVYIIQCFIAFLNVFLNFFANFLKIFYLLFLQKSIMIIMSLLADKLLKASTFATNAVDCGKPFIFD